MLNFPSLNFHLGETIDMLRATVQQFAADEIAPRAADIDRANQFPADLWRKMGDLGLLGITVEEEYGGTGDGLSRAHRRDGRDLARVGVGRACPMARIRTCASTRSAATAARRRSGAICPS